MLLISPIEDEDMAVSPLILLGTLLQLIVAAFALIFEHDELVAHILKLNYIQKLVFYDVE